jgi:hypothetical protein
MASTASPDANDAFCDLLGAFPPAHNNLSVGFDLFRPSIWLTLDLVAAGALLVPRGVRDRAAALEVGLTVVGGVAFECTYCSSRARVVAITTRRSSSPCSV